MNERDQSSVRLVEALRGVHTADRCEPDPAAVAHRVHGIDVVGAALVEFVHPVNAPSIDLAPEHMGAVRESGARLQRSIGGIGHG